MLRKLALSLAVSAALGVSHANALGLGEIRVNSALNEPLDAEIRLTQVRDLSPLQIQPRMASLDEYAVGSSALGRYLRDIQFQVLVSPEGSGRILLRSSEPVQEPFLNFMVEVNWPSGRLVREYTLLLDPPVFDAAPAVRSTPAVSAPAPVTRTPQPEFKPAAPAASADNIRTRAGDGQVYVGVNDTLWELAKQNKPAGVTEHQMMLALLRKNPQAFPSGNINAMKAGVVMDVPNKAEAEMLSHREAVAEVARQMKLWRDGKAGMTSKPAPVDVSKQPAQNGEAADGAATADAGDDGNANANEGADDAGEQGQLTIVAPDEQASESDASAPAGESVDSSAEEGAAPQDTEQTITDVSSQLENEVLVAQEKIDVLERENADLNDKLNSVLEQLESQTRMLELQSQQMATLQAEMSRQDEAAKSQSPLDTVMENPTLLGGIGAGALAILAGLWLALRRRGADKPEKAKPDLVNVPDNLKERDEPEVPSAAVAAGAAGVAAGAALAADDDDSDELPKHAPLSDEEDDDFTRPAMQSLAPEEEQADLGDDLQSLDLDMDLDLDDLDAQDEVDDNLSDTVSELDAAEFDLGVEESEASEAEVDSEDNALEFPTADTEEASEPVADEDDELEFKVAPLSAEEDQDSDLDALLGGDDTSDDLDFMLADNDQPTEVTDEAVDGDDELEALFGASSEESRVEAAADEDDNSVADTTLHETVEPLADDDYEIDSELDAMLAGSADDDEEDAVDLSGFEADSAEDDLDSLLADFDPVSEDDGADELQLRNPVEEELTSNISHDLEMDLDSEVDEMLNSTDDEIELSEERNDDAVEILDKMNLLSGTDETETKLDLARAYLEMDDREGARDILQEITSEGSQSQREQAQKLLDTLG
ncbi:FimV/HubP family polar landmark protein [Marinobacterium stanieri]|uniref:FimV/HubP family polar landmark protein n=1 Tax=Marinobacterium stanieri TaxID=49186 RepID=UPI000255A334|nr:FimV/HubP family polar landmark protein [Marinobacterium stanieri]